MASQPKQSAYFIAAFVGLLLFPIAGVGQRSRQQRTIAPTNQPQQLLERADFYLRTDDTSDVADHLYKQIVDNYPTSSEAGYAQYNRGSYWQRKFYILKAKTGVENTAALKAAESEFYNFLQKFRNSSNYTGLIADAHFYLALVYLQQGNRDNAMGWLNLMNSDVADRDSTVYVYKVVWSPEALDLLDRNVSSRYLAQETKKLIQRNLPFQKVVSGVRSWCRKQ
jgi:tetratricopeptide (TPR) repeat protein